MIKRIAFVFLMILVLLAGLSYFYLTGCEDDWCVYFEWQKPQLVHSFEECVLRGFPVMESYPRQCSDGEETFVEKLPTE